MITIHCGDSADILKQYSDNHFDSVVTDPPYGIAFLGKEWDSKKADETTSKLPGLQNLPSGMKHTSLMDDLAFQEWMRTIFTECMRVLKPGGYLLAFSAARTYHHMAMAAQTAGFDIKDQLMWLYSSGFPKAQDCGKQIIKQASGRKSFTITDEEITQLTKIDGDMYFLPDGRKVRKLPNTKGSGAADQYGGNKWVDTYEEVLEERNEWSGWKTALKPAHEPIVMARKPTKLSFAANVQKWGTGALNIDATRIPFESDADRDDQPVPGDPPGTFNNILTEAQGGERWRPKKSDKPKPQPLRKKPLNFKDGIEYEPAAEDAEMSEVSPLGRYPSNVIGEVEGYQKYFYCPKVGRKERHLGFEDIPMFDKPEGEVNGSNGVQPASRV